MALANCRLIVDHVVADLREAAPNPFNIPADEDIFRHREEDKRLKTEARIVALQQSVSAKTTFASRMQATTTEEAKQLIRQLRWVQGSIAPALHSSSYQGPAVP
jgi:hypothetical protein